MGVPYAEVIGDPIAHSKSPAIHRFWLEKLGKTGDYRGAHIPSDALAAYFESRRSMPFWRGCNVTLPHKQAVLHLLDEVSPEARQIGAVNIVTRLAGRLIGANSDVEALRAELRHATDESQLFDLPAILIGAGGAARAALKVLSEVDGLEVWILNRDVAKGQLLLDEFGVVGRAAPLESRLPTAGLLINASCLGMNGFPPLALDPAEAGRPEVVDLVYAPVETALLRRARARNMLTVSGLDILIGQAAIAFTRFFGFSPPSGTEEELRELLSQ